MRMGEWVETSVVWVEITDVIMSIEAGSKDKPCIQLSNSRFVDTSAPESLRIMTRMDALTLDGTMGRRMSGPDGSIQYVLSLPSASRFLIQARMTHRSSRRPRLCISGNLHIYSCMNQPIIDGGRDTWICNAFIRTGGHLFMRMYELVRETCHVSGVHRTNRCARPSVVSSQKVGGSGRGCYRVKRNRKSERLSLGNKAVEIWGFEEGNWASRGVMDENAGTAAAKADALNKCERGGSERDTGNESKYHGDMSLALGEQTRRRSGGMKERRSLPTTMTSLKG